MQLENWLYTIPVRLRSLLVRHLQDEDLDEELRDHIARQTEENRSRGMSEEEARLAALRTFGNFVAVREQTHETWAWATMERLWQDFRRALRSARRAPLLSGVAVLALALGIGLNTGVFPQRAVDFVGWLAIQRVGSRRTTDLKSHGSQAERPFPNASSASHAAFNPSSLRSCSPILAARRRRRGLSSSKAILRAAISAVYRRLLITRATPKRRTRRALSGWS